MNWKTLFLFINLDENTLKKYEIYYISNIKAWINLFKYQRVSINYLIEHEKIIFSYDLFSLVLIYQNLTLEYIMKYTNKITKNDKKLIFIHQNCNDELVKLGFFNINFNEKLNNLEGLS